jgi:hypothetical protein
MINMSESSTIIKLFEKSLRELMEFHYQNLHPFYKEADAQSYLFMKLFEKLKDKNLLFTKDGLLILRSSPKYPFKKGMKYFDLGMIPRNFNEFDKEGYMISASDYKYVIATEMKTWLSSRDLKKLSKLLEERKVENCYLVLFDIGKEPEEELLNPTDFSKRFYRISPSNKILKSRVKIFYSFIFEGQKGRDVERFEIRSKNNVTVLTKKGVIVD